MNSGFTLFLSVLFCDGNLAGIGVSWSLVGFFFFFGCFIFYDSVGLICMQIG